MDILQNAKNNIAITIIIPAFNEEKDIGNCLRKIEDYLKIKGIDYKIIVVDDGSTDKTAQVVENYIKGSLRPIILLRNNSRSGKGAAVRKGVLNAGKCRYILFLDTDLSTPICEIDNFLFWIDKGYDMVIATRKLDPSNVNDKRPLLRRYFSAIFLWLANLILLGHTISDVTCGFKCLTYETANRIFRKQFINGWAFDAELLFLCQKENLKIKEEPVCWTASENTRVVLIRDMVVSFLELIEIRLNYLKGRYKLR
jgi:dolichyl-phosphate beta-glucosyltransferase